jgi:hypothetical protein
MNSIVLSTVGFGKIASKTENLKYLPHQANKYAVINEPSIFAILGSTALRRFDIPALVSFSSFI